MATFRGQDGSATVDATAVGELRDWSLDGVEIEQMDDTVKGDTHRTGKGGIANSGSARFTCWLDYGDAGQAKVIDYFSGTPNSAGVTVVLLVGAGKSFTFTGVPQTYSLGSPEGTALCPLTFVFKVSGAVTIAWA